MRAANILHLGVKELRSLARDPMLLVLIAYSFTVSIYAAATAAPESLTRAAQAILYRGAGLAVVWPQFLATAALGAALFGAALARFRTIRA